MANVVAYIRQDYSRSDNLCPIYLYFYMTREKIRINTEIFISADKWDDSKKIIKGRDKDTKDKNLILSDSLSYITDIFVRYRLMRKKLTKETFMREWENRAASKNFITYMQKRLDEKLRQNDIAKSTHTTQKRIVVDLREFKKLIPFGEINEKLLKDFRSSLKKKKNSVNTIDKKFRILHTYLADAIKDKFLDHNPLDDIKNQKEDVKVSYLDDFELTKLVQLYNSRSLSPEHQHICRMFLFACLTGLRISDAMAATMSDLHGGYLQLKMKKTARTSGRMTRIPLTQTVKAIVTEANPDNVPGRIFDYKITEQAINRNLKQIATLAEISKNISFKTGRHTFGYLYYKKTKDLLSLQNLMGHSKIEQTLVYAHLNDQDVIEGMHKFDTYSIVQLQPIPLYL